MAVNFNPYYSVSKPSTKPLLSAGVDMALQRGSNQIADTASMGMPTQPSPIEAGAIGGAVTALTGAAKTGYERGKDFQSTDFKSTGADMIQGAKAGFALGGIPGGAVGAVLAPIAGGIGNAVGEGKAIENLKLSTTDLYSQAEGGNPMYQGATYSQDAQNIDQLSKVADSYGSNQGRLMGPGGVFKLATGKLLGNDRDARRKRDSMLKELRSQQTSFNQASEGFEQREVAQEQYRRNRNRTNRLYNLYNATGQQLY